MKSLLRFTVCWCLLVGMGVHHVRAAFTSLYVFGDGVCTTTNNFSAPTVYYGNRYCNGRVWVEVLAQWQGLSYDSNKNWSFFGHASRNLTTNVDLFISPPDVSTALFVVWVNDADFVNNFSNGDFGPPYDNTRLTIWTNEIYKSVTNHAFAIQTLYNKGVRTLVMPNAVDLTKVPAYAALSPSSKAFVRQRTIDFNTDFSQVLSNATATLSGLKIVQPDIFTLVDNIYANPTNFGLILPPQSEADNAIQKGFTVLDGPGANFMFWDDLHPTAKFQMYFAERAQELLTPARISHLIAGSPSNQLDLVSLPVGRNGVVEASTNFLNWSTSATLTTTNLIQSILVPAPGDQGFYRLRFPFLWTWP